MFSAIPYHTKIKIWDLINGSYAEVVRTRWVELRLHNVSCYFSHTDKHFSNLQNKIKLLVPVTALVRCEQFCVSWPNLGAVTEVQTKPEMFFLSRSTINHYNNGEHQRMRAREEAEGTKKLKHNSAHLFFCLFSTQNITHTLFQRQAAPRCLHL